MFFYYYAEHYNFKYTTEEIEEFSQFIEKANRTLGRNQGSTFELTEIGHKSSIHKSSIKSPELLLHAHILPAVKEQRRVTTMQNIDFLFKIALAASYSEGYYGAYIKLSLDNELQRWIVQRLLSDEGIKSNDVYARKVAVNLLGKLKLNQTSQETISKKLMSYLGNTSERFRQFYFAACTAAANIIINTDSQKKIVESLIQATKHSDMEVSLAACDALGHLRLDDNSDLISAIISALIKCLFHPEPRLRVAAYEALHQLKWHDAIKILAVDEIINCWEQTQGSLVDYYMLLFLCALAPELNLNDELQTKLATRLCYELFNNNSAWPIKFVAAIAFLKLKFTADLKEMKDIIIANVITKINEPGYDAICANLDDSIFEAETDSDTKVKIIASLVREARQQKEKTLAISFLALGKLTAPEIQQQSEVVEVLLENINNKNEKIRTAVCIALGTISLPLAKQKIVLEALIKATNDPEKQVYEAAYKTLGELQLQDADLQTMLINALIKITKEDNYNAYKALITLGNRTYSDEELNRIIPILAGKITIVGDRGCALLALMRLSKQMSTATKQSLVAVLENTFGDCVLDKNLKAEKNHINILALSLIEQLKSSYQSEEIFQLLPNEGKSEVKIAEKSYVPTMG